MQGRISIEAESTGPTHVYKSSRSLGKLLQHPIKYFHKPGAATNKARDWQSPNLCRATILYQNSYTGLSPAMHCPT